MQPQSHDAGIVSELFERNEIYTEYSTAVYDSEGHVTKLSILGKNPTPLLLPADFGQLTSLRELYVYARLLRFPDEICQFRKLRALILIDTDELCHIPPELANLKELEHLGLTYRLDLMEFPLALCQLRNLQTLDVSQNGLMALPPEIGQLTQLRSLYLRENDLSQLPVEIGELTNLKLLSFPCWSRQ